MGQENDKEYKDKKFTEFTLNSDLLSKYPKNAIVLNCLTAYMEKVVPMVEQLLGGNS